MKEMVSGTSFQGCELSNVNTYDTRPDDIVYAYGQGRRHLMANFLPHIARHQHQAHLEICFAKTMITRSRK